jgi:hypothetical protein
MNPIVENIMALHDEAAEAKAETIRLEYETWHRRFKRDAVHKNADDTKQALRTAIEQALGQGEVLTDEQRDALIDARQEAMLWTLRGRIPECGVFAGIAQNLDWLCGQLVGEQPQPKQEPERAESSVDYWQQRGYLGSPEEWREACRLYRSRCSEQDVQAMAKLHAYIEDGLLEVRRPAAAPQPKREWVDLTYEEVAALTMYNAGWTLARAIEQRLKEKNT